MKIIVLGAGIIGTASAYFLNLAGHDVTVIDRQAGVALETSFANGCQISVSHAQPWANPSAPLTIIKSLGEADAPLLFKLRPEWLQWRWAWQFLKECKASNSRNNLRQLIALSQYSQQTLQQVRAQVPITYDCLTKGILHFYTNQQEFDASILVAQTMSEMGCTRTTITREHAFKIEPALAHSSTPIVGADFTPSDESGDVYQFTQGLALAAKNAGVNFKFNHHITRLMTTGTGAAARVTGVEVINENGFHEVQTADAFVVALGSFSTPLLAPLGIHLALYPGKGYSATYGVIEPDATPQVSLIDDEFKLVFSRLGNRLRVAGTLELNGYSRALNPIRCEAITRRTRALFPEACNYDAPTYWAGLRPLTPSNLPYIGRSQLSNLYLNTGHGTLGWTMGCGSGRAIAEIIDGKRPDVDAQFLGI